MIMAASISAAPSEEKKTNTKEDAAQEEYNKGVGHMDQAQAILLKGDSAFAYNYRATSDAKAQREYKKAIYRFQRALESKPDMKEALNNLGYCYRKIGEFENSLKAYTRAIAFDKDFAQAREYLGETYLAMDSLDQALEQLDYLKKLESPLADTLALAIASYKLDKTKK